MYGDFVQPHKTIVPRVEFVDHTLPADLSLGSRRPAWSGGMLVSSICPRVRTFASPEDGPRMWCIVEAGNADDDTH